MTPAAMRNSNLKFNGTGMDDNEDPKLMELMAKQAFMKVDERTMAAFREQGKTPTLRSSDPMLSETQQNKKTMR